MLTHVQFLKLADNIRKYCFIVKNVDDTGYCRSIAINNSKEIYVLKWFKNSISVCSMQGATFSFHENYTAEITETWPNKAICNLKISSRKNNMIIPLSWEDE